MSKKFSRGFLHFIQHLSFIGAVLFLTLFLYGGLVEVHTKNGEAIYQLTMKDADTSFEDSEIFNRILGHSVSDLICYGTIRSQMETDGVFDPEKEVDVTAFAQRYGNIRKEYRTGNKSGCKYICSRFCNFWTRCREKYKYIFAKNKYI